MGFHISWPARLLWLSLCIGIAQPGFGQTVRLGVPDSQSVALALDLLPGTEPAYYADSGATGQWDVVVQSPTAGVSVWVDGRLLALGYEAGFEEKFPADSFLMQEGWHHASVYSSNASDATASAQLIFIPKAQAFSKSLAKPRPVESQARLAPTVATIAKAPPTRIELLPILLFPVLVLVLWRLTDADTFDRMMAFKLGYRRMLDQAAQGNLLRGVSSIWALLLRLSLLAAVAAMVVYYGVFKMSGSPIPSGALRGNWLALAQLSAQPMLLFVTLLGLSVLYITGRYLLLAVVTLGFGVRGFVRGFAATEALASLPGLLVVFLVAFVGFHVPVGYMKLIWALLWITLVAYGVVRNAVVLLGLAQYLRLPWVGVVLYICTLEILPWLVLFT